MTVSANQGFVDTFFFLRCSMFSFQFCNVATGWEDIRFYRGFEKKSL